MLFYRGVDTLIHQPVSQPLPREGAQPEWADMDGIRVLDCWGYLRPLESQPEDTPLGSGARQLLRWRGQLPDEVEPQPGWTVEIGEARYCTVKVDWTCGRVWSLDLERVD